MTLKADFSFNLLGKTIDLRPKMIEIEAGMKGISELQGLVSMPRWQDKPENISNVPRCETMASFISSGKGDKTLRFERVGFQDPFLIVYSSGTTGMPKCIVHSAGAVLMNKQKESNLHRDVSAIDPDNLCTLQFTTTGWIMYMTSCLSISSGGRAILYDGSPFQPDLKAFIKLWGDQKVTDLGLSPRYFQTLATAKPPVSPREVTDLSHLRRVTSTGMVLSDVQFEWFVIRGSRVSRLEHRLINIVCSNRFYDEGFPAHVQLANISGGTGSFKEHKHCLKHRRVLLISDMHSLYTDGKPDLAACLTLDTLMKPLYVGGTMTPGLGMKVEVFDQEVEGGRGVKGKPLPPGEQGE